MRQLKIFPSLLKYMYQLMLRIQEMLKSNYIKKEYCSLKLLLLVKLKLKVLIEKVLLLAKVKEQLILKYILTYHLMCKLRMKNKKIRDMS